MILCGPKEDIPWSEGLPAVEDSGSCGERDPIMHSHLSELHLLKGPLQTVLQVEWGGGWGLGLSTKV